MNVEDIRDLTIGIVGAGRVGCALAVLSRRKGLPVAFIVDSERAKATRCAELCGSREAAATIREIEENADIVLLVVPDDGIESVVSEISADPGRREIGVVAHMSGLKTSDVLAPLKRTGARVCSCHPAFSFPEDFDDDLEGVPFALEGDAGACEIMERLVDLFGGRTVRIAKEEKARYHLGCTMASNYLVALAGVVDSLFKEVRGVESFAYALPLVRATLHNIGKSGTAEALTGPIVRGDVHTVKRHLDLLKDIEGDTLLVYIALGRVTLKTAAEAGLSETRREEIESLFRRYEEGAS